MILAITKSAVRVVLCMALESSVSLASCVPAKSLVKRLMTPTSPSNGMTEPQLGSIQYYRTGK